MIREKISNYGTSNLTVVEILELITGKEFTLPKDNADSQLLLNNLIRKNITEMMYLNIPARRSRLSGHKETA